MTKEEIRLRCEHPVEITIMDWPEVQFMSEYGMVSHSFWCDLEIERIQRGGRRAYKLVNGGDRCCVVVDVGRSTRS